MKLLKLNATLFALMLVVPMLLIFVPSPNAMATEELPEGVTLAEGWSLEHLILNEKGNADYALDANGHHHIIYWNATSDIMYATDSSGSWVVEKVIDGSLTISRGRIAVNSTGNPAIICSSSEETPGFHMNALLYIKDGTSWDTYEFDDYATDGNSIGQDVGIQYDSQDDLHVYLSAGKFSQTYYLYEYYGNIDDGFTKSTVTTGTATFYDIEVALDQYDYPTVLYRLDAPIDDFVLQTYAEESWHESTISDGGASSEYVGLYVYDQEAYVTFLNSTTNSVYAMLPNEGSWDTHELYVATGDDYAQMGDIIVNDEGIVYVSYHIYNDTAIGHYAVQLHTYDGVSWSDTTIMEGLDAFIVSMAFDDDGTLSICIEGYDDNIYLISYGVESEPAFTYAWADNSPSSTADKGDSYSYNFNTNDEANTTYALNTDADWLDIVAGTGVLSGTAVAGTYYVNVTADNGTVELYHNYTLTVAMTLNWVNHSPSESANEGVAYSYTFSVDEDDAVFSLTTDAEWLSINATTGVLSGTTEDGEFYVNVTATLDELSVYENYTLTITNVPIAWVNHSPTASVNEGVAYAYTFTTNKDGELFLLDGNASWLSINATTGVLSGTAQDGVFSVNVSAFYDDETIWHNYTLTVTNVPIVWVNHAPGATGTNDSAYSYTFTTNKVGEVFDVDTNATWLSINATTGVLSGTAEAGIYYVNVTASFDGEEIYHNYTLTISEPAPPTTRQQTFEMLPELTVAVFLILCIGIFVFMLWTMVGRVEKR